MNRCDICGSTEHYAGVASSYLGPISIGHCKICVAMHAQPGWLINATIESVDGMQNLHPDLPLIYYDPETDCYIDKWTERPLWLSTTDGRKFMHKSELMEALKEMKK